MRLLISYCSLLTMAILLGCSGGDSREYGSLSGKVMLNGEPASSGTILNFLNTKNGVATSARVEDGGTYKVPRVQVGSYNVAVNSQGSNATEEVDPDAAMQQIESGSYETPDEKSQIPEKYTVPEQSPLTVTIEVGKNNKDFDVK